MNTPISELAQAAHAVTAASPTPVPDQAERIGAALRDALRCAADGNAASACSMLDKVAQTAGVPLLLDLPAVLAVHQPWFGVAASECTQELIERGFLPCWFDPNEVLPASGRSPGSVLTPTTVAELRDLRYQGISLWEVARYDFCVRHELSLAEAERSLVERSDALLREYARARALIDRAVRYVDIYQPQCALVAQGHVMASAAVRAVAQARGVRVVAIENTFHSERLLWDDDAALPVVASRAKSVWLREGSRVSDADAEAYVADFLGRAKTLKSSQHASPRGMPPWPVSDGRGRIVVLGQVATDAAVLFGLRRGFTRQLDMIRAVAAYADRNGHALVIKLHPKEATGQSPLATPYRRLTERQLQDDPVLAEMLERGTFTLDADNAIDTDRLTDGADVCVAVNSQAGLEALVRGREVVLCGEAFYGNLGFTHEPEDPASLDVALDRALSDDGKRNRGAEAKRFFYTYLEKLCLPKTPGVMAQLCAPRVEEAFSTAADCLPTLQATAEAKFDEENPIQQRRSLTASPSVREAPRPGRYSHLFAGDALEATLDHCDFHTVLDVGSGAGDHADAFHENGKHVTSIDFGVSVYHKQKDEHRDVIIGDYYSYKFTEPFDLVWASHVLEHQPNPNLFLKKLHSDLKEGGWVAISVPPLKHEIVGGHVTLWNAGLLLYQMIFAGFNCRHAAVKSYGYNISVIVQKRSIETLPELHYDSGDIDRLGAYFPEGLSEGFNGNIGRLQWPPSPSTRWSCGSAQGADGK